jgi:hypothetical protein
MSLKKSFFFSHVMGISFEETFFKGWGSIAYRKCSAE